MAVAFSSGGLGEILAICQIGLSLGKAISDERGSAKDYQEFRQDVDSLIKVLMQVVVTYEKAEASPLMADLATTIKSIIDECGKIMQEELSRLRVKYHDGLQPGGSGSKSTDMYKKMKFGVTEKEQLREVREKLGTRTQQLSTLVAIAAQRNSQAGTAAIMSRLEAIDETLTKSVHCQGQQSETQGMQSAEEYHRMAQSRILNGLAFDQLDTRFDEVSKAYAKTFEWIFDDKSQYRDGVSFKHWLSTGSGIFHIAGKPGSGKSTLMKFLCNNSRTQEILNTWANGKVLILAKFFFWKPGRVIQKSQNGLLRSILHQCLSGRPELIPAVFPRLWKDAELRGWSASTALTFTDDDVHAAFTALMRNSELFSKHRLCFFVDGLDEYEESDKDFQDLVTLLHEWTEKAPLDLKICVSSRELNAFEMGFSPEKRYRLQDLTRDDFSQVIYGRLQPHRPGITLPNAQISRLAEQILSKSQGVFLWVTLVLRSIRESLLNGDPLDTIQTKIDQLPEELEQLFRNVADSIDATDRKIAAQTLAIAKFPDKVGDAPQDFPFLGYSSSWYFYLENYNKDPNFAIAMRTMNRGMGRDEFRDQQDIARRRVYGRCKGLVEVSPGRRQLLDYGRYIYITHRTV
ncbi:unnamed protein product [Clonostachys rosea]|uniref:Nephrocystin 3-like N-terminal domain-containing protein n=1 Tax=Bionectria ochroleuca TaxID=29856 RepID=A0ABY6U7F6_BIOOC|nr:unnamed protein product [Clonostachys rosea]